MVKKKMVKKKIVNKRKEIKRPLPFDGYWKPIK